MTFAQLSRLAPRVDWESYFAEAGLPRIDLNVAEPAFRERLDRELEATPVAVWKAYLTLHLLESAAPWLSNPSPTSPSLRDKYLGGATDETARDALSRVDGGSARGAPRPHVRRAVLSSRGEGQGPGDGPNLLAVLKDEVGGLKWMSAATRRKALAKLEAYDVKVGYPDRGPTLGARHSPRRVLGERRRGPALRRRGRTAGASASAAERDLWQLPPSSPDAYIDVQLNQMVLPAGFLQPPAFDLAADDAVNYGAIGIGMAHDLTHAIDCLGADFDSTGRPRKWWTEPIARRSRSVGQCVVDQYDGYAIEPGVHSREASPRRGDRRSRRRAPGLPGASKRSMQRHPVPVIDGLSPEQQFFIAWGQFRGAAESPKLQRQMVKGDPHPTARYRVIGPLSNSPEFQQAFACRTGSAMVRPPEQRCVVWLTARPGAGRRRPGVTAPASGAVASR